MKAKTDRPAELIAQFALVLNKLAALEKYPRDFGTGDELFPSEIHAVEAIGKHQGVNMTDLASVLGISKPAATQIVAKVAKKGLVERYNGEGNKKEVLLRLTPKGTIAFTGHRDLHTGMDAGIIDRLKKLTSCEQDLLSDLIRGMAEYFDRAIDERTPKVSSDGSFGKKRGKARAE